MSPDFPEDFFKLTLDERPTGARKVLELDPIYPKNASLEDVNELDENCKLLGEICASIQESLRYGFSDPKISEHLFIALHIYGNPTTIAYCPSRLINQHILIQNGEKSNRFFLLNCRTGLVGSQDRRIGRGDRIFIEEGRVIIRQGGEDEGIDPVPSFILKHKEMSDQYVVRPVPGNMNTFVVIITQSDYPDRVVIKIAPAAGLE